MRAKDSTDDLFELFLEYVNFGSYTRDEVLMDNTRFARLVRQLVLVDSNTRVTLQDADVAFHQTVRKGGGGRRMSYDQFIDALGLLAPMAFPHLHPEQGLAALVDSILYVYLSSKHRATLRSSQPGGGSGRRFWSRQEVIQEGDVILREEASGRRAKVSSQRRSTSRGRAGGAPAQAHAHLSPSARAHQQQLHRRSPANADQASPLDALNAEVVRSPYRGLPVHHTAPPVCYFEDGDGASEGEAPRAAYPSPVPHAPPSFPFPLPQASPFMPPPPPPPPPHPHHSYLAGATDDTESLHNHTEGDSLSEASGVHVFDSVLAAPQPLLPRRGARAASPSQAAADYRQGPPVPMWGMPMPMPPPPGLATPGMGVPPPPPPPGFPFPPTGLPGMPPPPFPMPPPLPGMGAGVGFPPGMSPPPMPPMPMPMPQGPAPASPPSLSAMATPQRGRRGRGGDASILSSIAPSQQQRSVSFTVPDSPEGGGEAYTLDGVHGAPSRYPSAVASPATPTAAHPSARAATPTPTSSTAAFSGYSGASPGTPRGTRRAHHAVPRPGYHTAHTAVPTFRIHGTSGRRAVVESAMHGEAVKEGMHRLMRMARDDKRATPRGLARSPASRSTSRGAY